MIQDELMLDSDYIWILARTASHKYKEYRIPKASGGYRQIYQPSKEIKIIQRTIYELVLINFPVHKAAGAYRKGIGLKDHVMVHEGARYLLRMDFANFFPSLTIEDFRIHVRKFGHLLPKRWSETDTDLLIKFVFRNGRLTIGAVTSPFLSNTLCYNLDCILTQTCNDLGVNYTRYADDMFFSSIQPNLLPKIEQKVSQLLGKIEYPKRLQINTRKTRHSSKKGKMAITGLILTSDNSKSISIGHSRKRKIRSEIHKWNQLDDTEKRSLSGLLAYCQAIEPDFVNRLFGKYGIARMTEIRSFMKVNVDKGYF